MGHVPRPFYGFFLVFLFLFFGVMGVRRNTATCPRQAMVDAVAFRQALEGEGEAFVGVGGRKEFPLSVDRNRTGAPTQVDPGKLSLHIIPGR